MIFSLLPATTAATIMTIAITETSGMMSTLFFACSFKKNWTIKPRMIGRITIFKIDINMVEAETSNHSRASTKMIAGVKIGASKVETDVTATESAVFPFARNVMTFEAVPPGHDPTRITPIAISAGKLNPLFSIK